MKKRLLITSALMTAVLGASLATGTYAWYKAGEVGNSYAEAVKVNTISTKENSYTTGSFKVEAILGTVTDKVDLTDKNGNTYYYLPNGTTLVNAGEAATKTGTSDVKIKITYTGAEGTNLNADEISALWKTLKITEVKVTLKAEGQVKVGTTSTAAVAVETPANAIDYTFETAEITFADDGTYTAAAQNWYYGVAGLAQPEDPTTSGSVTATPATGATAA